MRYPVSGSNAMWPGEASSGADNASTGAELLVHGTATSTLASRKKVFYLRSLWAHPVASALVIALADASVGATAILPLTQFRMTVASWVGGDASQCGIGNP